LRPEHRPILVLQYIHLSNPYRIVSVHRLKTI
jgi:hypothetical protein